MNGYFKLCSTCKKEIAYGSSYYSCSVSSCNRKRLALFFCSVPCWDAHVPGARHRDAWAELEKAPLREEEISKPAFERRIIGASKKVERHHNPNMGLNNQFEKETLVVASKLKKYVKERGDLNMSASVLEHLSDHLRTITDAAMINAKADERKTVLERDFIELTRRTSDIKN